MSIRCGLMELPDSPELASLTGGRLEERTGDRRVLHEWPLSRVEEAVLSLPPEQDRTEHAGEKETVRYIVKSQVAGASSECGFYRRYGGFVSEGGAFFIPEAVGIGCSDDFGTVPTGAEPERTDWLILPLLEGTTEDWSAMTDGEIRARVRQVNGAFRTKDFEDAPVFTDWRTHGRFAEDLGEDFQVFAKGGLSDEEAEAARDLIREGLKDCWDATVGLLHGDLKGENLLTLTETDGTQRQRGRTAVLDWQRPIRAPLPLEEELSLLLSDRGESGEGEKSAFRRLACLSLAHWYALAYRRWIPYPFVCGMAGKYARKAL